jgi:hypothetical protein
MSYLALANHLPFESPERLGSFEKAKEAFACGGLEYWAAKVQAMDSQSLAVGLT